MFKLYNSNDEKAVEPLNYEILSQTVLQEPKCKRLKTVSGPGTVGSQGAQLARLARHCDPVFAARPGESHLPHHQVPPKCWGTVTSQLKTGV